MSVSAYDRVKPRKARGVKEKERTMAQSQNGAEEAADAGVTDAQKPTVSHIFGEMVWLMSQSPTHKHFAVADLEWMIMPPILLEQFRIFRGPDRPLGFALWAFLSEEAEARFDQAAREGRGGRLRPDDWRSGDRPWLVELVAPGASSENGMVGTMLEDLTQNVFKDQGFKYHQADPETGQRLVKEAGV